MQRNFFALLMMAVLGASYACGDKLNPGIVEVDDENSPPPTSGTNPNVTANPNATANGNPNTVVPPPTTGLCGTSATAITYDAHVKPLITQKCGNCHSVGGNMPTMNTYAQAKAAFSTGTALEQVDSGQMPQGAPLTENQVCLFDTWAKTSYAE
jgi:hypothetical protein